MVLSDLTTAALVTLGAGLMALSAISAREILRLVRDGKFSRTWRVLVGMILLFLVGYVAVLVAVVAGFADILVVLSGGIFFLGALFVFLVVRIGRLTIDHLVKTTVSEAQLSSIVDSALDVIAILDADGTIKFISPSTEAVLGFLPDEVVGKNAFEFFHPEDAQEVIAAFKRAAGGPIGIPSRNTRILRFRQKNDSWRFLEVLANRLPDEQESPRLVITARDITVRRETETMLRRLALMVESSTEAIVTNFAGSGEVTSWNRAAENLYGYSQEEVLGKPVSDLFVPSDRQGEFTALAERLSRGETIAQYETVRQRKNGELVNVSVSLAPMMDEEGQITEVALIAMDISERKRLEKEIAEHAKYLESTNEQLRSLDKLKSSLVATVSHELRTPLTSIIGYTELLLEEEVSDEERLRFLHVIKNESDRLASLINDFLDLSKIESGIMDWRDEPLQLETVVDKVISVLEIVAQYSDVRLDTQVSADLPQIWCDPDRIAQVVTNLVSNAIKFTPAGGQVSVIGEMGSEGEQSVLIRVVDSGVGIEPEDQEKIFDRFSQIGNQLDGRPKGTGLGLPICKQIVEHYGGRIWVESKMGAGSTFFVSLPVSTPTEELEGSSKKSMEQREATAL